MELDPDRVLRISTAHKTEHKEEGERAGWRFHRQERSSASASRALQLPENVDVTGVTANVDNGVLKVVVPKLASQAATTRRIPVA